MNPDDIKPVQWEYKSTTAFDDQYSYGFEAQEIGQAIPNVVFADSAVSEHNITMIAGGTEMLRVAQDGFYVRGVKVPADDKEAETVYNAFKQFLVWSEMNRR